MDFKAILAAMGPLAEPFLEEGVEKYWPELDLAIAQIAQPDVKLVLSLLSPALKQFVESEIKKLA